jgi:hypothetical protein
VDGALSDMHRVLRRGGRVLIVDTDWDAVVWYTADPARMRRVMQAWETHCADSRLPRTLAARLAAVGFRIDRISGWSIVNTTLNEENYSRGLLGLIRDFVARNESVPDEELAAWAAEQRALSEAGRYFFATTRFFFCASKASG